MATVAPYDFDEHVELATFIDDQPVFALVDGTVRFPVSQDLVIEANDGLLSAAQSLDRKSIVTYDIHADMWAQPMPMELYLRSQVDVTTGELQLERIA